eukprot:2390275-Rhodomonas_salina.1
MQVCVASASTLFLQRQIRVSNLCFPLCSPGAICSRSWVSASLNHGCAYLASELCCRLCCCDAVTSVQEAHVVETCSSEEEQMYERLDLAFTIAFTIELVAKYDHSYLGTRLQGVLGHSVGSRRNVRDVGTQRSRECELWGGTRSSIVCTDHMGWAAFWSIGSGLSFKTGGTSLTYSSSPLR